MIDTVDYSLTKTASKKAKEKGLVDADWYLPPISKKDIRNLLERKDKPATFDTILWFGLIFSSGYGIYYFWQTYWVILPILIYSVLYYSTADSRWHESGHGTAFKTDWMNDLLYQISSFMIYRLPISWRWSHARHHSDTIIIGRDPEISVPRPPNIKGIILKMFGLKTSFKETKKLLMHLIGKVGEEESQYVPKRDYNKMFFTAWIWLFIYLFFIGLAIYFKTTLPLFYVIFPRFFGSYLYIIYGLTQHAGLAENVLDHRKNTRTVHMNSIHRFLYWNMNYHLEHHFFPLVPYYNLPKLHEQIKDYCPKPYGSIFEAYKEIIPAIIKQEKDPTYFVKRELPEISERYSDEKKYKKTEKNLIDGWIEVCHINEIDKEDVIRLDYNEKTFAIYKTKDLNIYATDGMCTHGKTHLSNGLVIGDQIECPKHNGRFNIKDGTVRRPPVCLGLQIYETKITDNIIWINPNSGIKKDKFKESRSYEVVSNFNIATYIKELIIKPINNSKLEFTAGDYVQFEIPPYEMNFKQINIKDSYRKIWEKEGLLKLNSSNNSEISRNYSIATNPDTEDYLKFNIRLALSVNVSKDPPGIGSSYIFNLKKGDKVELFGPFGDFHLKQTDNEIVFIGGGAGMAPLRSQISNLFDSNPTNRLISFWYGARSEKELFYQDYFQFLDKCFDNFSFNVALSAPIATDNNQFNIGFIHEIVYNNYLKSKANLSNIEFYLCGPPKMIEACKKMLYEIGIKSSQILFDEF